MDEPWGINGPDFLALYGALLLAPALVSVVWWQLQKRRRRPGAGLPTGLSTYQLAWLAGGPVRAAQAAFVTLLERGAVRISSSGFLTRVDEEAGEPLEKEALSAAKRQHIAHAVRATSNRSNCNRIGDGLIEAGLLVPYAETDKRLRVTRWLYVAVLALGVVRLINGIGQRYPIGYLALLLVAGGLAVGLITVRLRRDRTGRTTLGDEVLRGERPAGGAAAAVALSGFAAHPDADTRAALTTKAPPEPRLRGARSGGAAWAYGGSVNSCSGGHGGSSCGGGGGCGGGGS